MDCPHLLEGESVRDRRYRQEEGGYGHPDGDAGRCAVVARVVGFGGLLGFGGGGGAVAGDVNVAVPLLGGWRSVVYFGLLVGEIFPISLGGIDGVDWTLLFTIATVDGKERTPFHE